MNWYYYQDNRKKGDPPIGPLSLDHLMKLILDGTLRVDTFVVRENPKECHHAHVFPEISERLPLDIDKLVETYLRSCVKNDWPHEGDEDWWAWDKADRMVLFRPEIGWEIIQVLVTRAKSDHELWFVGTGLLERLLEDHGALYIKAIEEKARVDRRFQQCLRGVDMIISSSEIWERVQRACAGPEPS